MVARLYIFYISTETQLNCDLFPSTVYLQLSGITSFWIPIPLPNFWIYSKSDILSPISYNTLPLNGFAMGFSFVVAQIYLSCIIPDFVTSCRNYAIWNIFPSTLFFKSSSLRCVVSGMIRKTILCYFRYACSCSLLKKLFRQPIRQNYTPNNFIQHPLRFNSHINIHISEIRL